MGANINYMHWEGEGKELIHQVDLIRLYDYEGHSEEASSWKNTYPVLRGLEDKWVVGHDELFQELEVLGRKLGPGVHEPDILPHN